MVCPVFGSHRLISTCTCLPMLLEASVLPSGLQATLTGLQGTPHTGFASPSRVRMGFSLPRSHSRMVPSTPAEASILPSGLQATSDTLRVCPTKVWMGLGFTISHRRNAYWSPEASVLPSGLQATLST